MHTSIRENYMTAMLAQSLEPQNILGANWVIALGYSQPHPSLQLILLVHRLWARMSMMHLINHLALTYRSQPALSKALEATGDLAHMCWHHLKSSCQLWSMHQRWISMH